MTEGTATAETRLLRKQGLNNRSEVETRKVSRSNWALMTRSYFPENEKTLNRVAEWGKSE